MAFIIIMLFLSGCSREPIKVGFSGNLTGTGSELGTNAMYGAYLAVEEVNERGGIDGRTIELVVQNDGNDINTAVEADKELIEEGVAGIIGHLLSGNGQLSIPYINENKTIMVSPTISSSAYAGQNDYFYTMMPVSLYQSLALSSALISHERTDIGLLYNEPNKAYAKPLVDNLEQDYLNHSGNVVFKAPLDTSIEADFDRTVELITDSDIDALVIVSPGFDTAKIIQRLSAYEDELPIYLPVWGMTNELLSNAGPLANGIYAINHYDAHNQGSKFTLFKDTYTQKYGSEPAFGAMFSYEATMFLLQGIEAAGSTDSKDIKKALDEIDTFDGLLGDVLIDEYGDAQRDMFLFQVQDETFIKVTE